MDRRHLIGLTLSSLALASAAHASPEKSGGGKGGYLSLPTATATVPVSYTHLTLPTKRIV